MRGSRAFRLSAGAVVVAVGLVTAPLQREAAGVPALDTVTATYQGVSIDPTYASHYFCHTRDYPAVRCFASQAEVDEDLGIVEPAAPRVAGASQRRPGGAYPPASAAGTPYTIAYRDADYRGTALTVFGSMPDLAVVGWSDSISSLKSIDCGRPRYYDLAGYEGPYWQDGCNEWSPSLGTLNDRFRSVTNVAP